MRHAPSNRSRNMTDDAIFIELRKYAYGNPYCWCVNDEFVIEFARAMLAQGAREEREAIAVIVQQAMYSSAPDQVTKLPERIRSRANSEPQS